MSESTATTPKTRTGKIARLPLAVREPLCQRLRDGIAGPPLLTWLNALPDVRAVLEREFDGVDVSAENLSQWRQGGYQDWLRKREAVEHKRELAAYCAELGESGKAIFAGGAAIAGGKLMEILEDIDVQEQKEILREKPADIVGLVEALTMLQGVAVRDKQLDHSERRLALAEKEYRRRFADDFLKFYADQKVRDIAESKATKTVKMEQLGLLLFGQRPELPPLNA